MNKKLMKKEIIEESLTFDDVLVVPEYSEVLPKEVNTGTYLTKKIRINIPIISAAMDMVTESRLAIAIAQEGGIGIIHRNMSIDEQVEEVKKVKRSENAIIKNPYTLPPTATLEEVTNLMEEKNIGGVPIVEKNNKLVGIITGRDIRSESDLSKKVAEVMTKKLITTGEECSLSEARNILLKNKIKKLPIINKNGILVGLITYKDIRKEASNPNACKDDNGRLRVGAAIGVGDDVLLKVQKLIEAGVDVIVLDSAHGHSKGILDTVKKIKKAYPKVELIAGNIATGAGALALAKAGADAVKVGVGPGSICTTRIISGVGVPQLGAIMDAKKALLKAGYEIPVIADGGIRYSGDMVKALVGGASVIMAGSIFAGTEESPGEVVIFEGRKFKNYRGMGSVDAMEKGSRDRYFQDHKNETSKLVPEGIVGIVSFTGKLSEIVYQYIGGLRSGMGYVGAKNIPDLWDKTFIKITASGKEENHPHDVIITKEAPNYSK